MKQGPEALMKAILDYIDGDNSNRFSFFWDLAREDSVCLDGFLAKMLDVLTKLSDSEVFGPFKELVRFYLPRRLSACSSMFKNHVQWYAEEFFDDMFKAGLGLEESTDRAELVVPLREINWSRREDVLKMDFERIKSNAGIAYLTDDERIFGQIGAAIDDACKKIQHGYGNRPILSLMNAMDVVGVERPEDFPVEATLMNEYNRFCRAWNSKRTRSVFQEGIESKRTSSWWPLKLGKIKTRRITKTASE